MRTKIYTKSGDLGETSLIGGLRVSKADPRLESYGTVDELNSSLGVLIAHLRARGTILNDVVGILLRIQNELFVIGSQLACEDDQLRASLPALSENFCVLLESEIDRMTIQLPELKEFILPGGSIESAQAHGARTVCRRAERAVCALSASAERKQIVVQLNRLSDYFFVLARFLNFKLAVADVTWQKHTPTERRK